MLTVINPFGGYAKGAQITDADEIKKILASEHATNVIRSAEATTDKPQPPRRKST